MRIMWSLTIKKGKNTRYEAVDWRLNITVGRAEEKEL